MTHTTRLVVPLPPVQAARSCLKALGAALALCLLLLAWGARPVPAQAERGIPADVRAEFERTGAVPLIVTFALPGLSIADLMAGGGVNMPLDTQALATIAEAQQALLARLAPYEPQGVKLFPLTPGLALTLDSLEGLAALYADPAVAAVGIDIAVPPAMDQTIPLIRVNNNHFLNYTGSGWSIAILDTGVDKNHPSLFGKVVSEACYSSNVSAQGASSLCPGGAVSSVANNSGLPCPANVSGCDHGTHVADIAARVAPGATIIAIQVFSRFTDSATIKPCQNVNRTSPCTLSFTSDQVLALSRVLALHITGNNIQVAAVNMSLGGGRYFTPCDNEAFLSQLLSSINQLRGQNIATVISAGNSGYPDSMGSPACLSPAISVAASDKSDIVASFSNISLHTTLIAPGTPILAAVPQTYTPIYQSKGGTSMAAPHVAGAIATLKEGQPNATVPQIISALTNSANPAITDNRGLGGSVTKRRLDAWVALCVLITCDSDDFRTLGANQTLTGALNPAGDVDNYYYFGSAGQRLTLRMNRTSGSMDPYLELFSPNGVRVALNDNGGGGVNALINGYLLPQNGLYQIRARSVNNFTGNYELIASQQTEQLNPTPTISHLSPSWAAGTFFGSDFWVAIYGSGFMPTSEVRWNGSLRAKFYSSPTLIYIRVLGSDIGWPWPRNAFITVTNPAPGGGTSNSRAFSINTPFLGESAMLAPETGSSVNVGVKQTFVISWTAPVEVGSWRDMQYMDMRLRNEQGEVAAWVRIVEQPGPDSFYRLLNAAEELIDEGMWGEDRDLVLTDTVTLHLAESSFSGSGLTAIMTPTLTFGPAAVGTYNVEFRVDSERANEEEEEGEGEEDDEGDEEVEPNVQEDVLGTFTILPAGCAVALTGMEISGESSGLLNTAYVFEAAVTPPNASLPITYTWSPEPSGGQGFANGVYTFKQAGEHVVAVTAENCGSFAAALRTITITSGPDADLSIAKRGPVSVLAGEPITYTLTITNQGAVTATNLVVTDTLPAGATYLAGGALEGDAVRFEIDALPGIGATAEVSFTVSATDTVTNHDYAVVADGAIRATSSVTVVTPIADALVNLNPLDEATLVYAAPDEEASAAAPGAVIALRRISITLPAGTVFDDTLLALFVSDEAPATPPTDTVAVGVFRLTGYRNGVALASETRLSEIVPLEVIYASSAISGLQPSTLRLLAWDGATWQEEGIACSHDENAYRLDCTLETPALTVYALVAAEEEKPEPEPSERLYLPSVIR